MLTIFNETTNFIKMVVFVKTIVFEKKITTLLNDVLHEVKQLWGEQKLLDIFLKTTQ